MLQKISGSQNNKVKTAKSLLLKKNRQKLGLFTVEGIKSVRDAIDAGAAIEMIFIAESFENEISAFEKYDCYILPDALFESISDTKTPQGVLAVIRALKNEKPIRNDGLYIYCDSVADPGNLGTIIRTADAAGINGVLLSPGCADLYSPKTVRSSMGSFFHIPIYENFGKEKLTELKNAGYKLYCGALGENTVVYTKADFNVSSIIAVGNEANGISDEVMKMADLCIKIPIFGAAESLNVGIAAAIMLYEAKRQRIEKN